MSDVVRLPKKFDIAAIDRFTREIVSFDLQPMRKITTLDFSGLDFIDGSGITVLTNTIEWLLANKSEVSFLNYDNMSKLPISYLDDCGFFRRYLQVPLSKYSRVRSTTLPCVSVDSARAFSWIEHNFSPWFQCEMNCSYSAVGSLRTCLKELFNNISDHSSRSTGFVHAQHFPRQHQIRVTLSDFGLGIPETIRSKFPNLTDSAALVRACEEGITAQSRPNNMGLGLNYLIDTILANGGQVRIRSLSANLHCSTDRSRQIRKATSGRGMYPGTLVEFSLDTRLFEGDNDERGEVEW